MRTAEIERITKETSISASLDIDGLGNAEIDTTIGFLDHMLSAFARHGLFDLTLRAKGDTEVDQHHLVEDIGIVIGQLFDKALGSRAGINRAGYFVFPMDEALSVVAVDICGRPTLQYRAEFSRRFIGDLDSDLFYDFFKGAADSMRASVAVRVLEGRNDHHKAEAIFKAWGKSMRMACEKDARAGDSIPSTKDMIE